MRWANLVRMTTEPPWHVVWVWALLTVPLAGLKLLVLLGIGYYTAAQFAGDAVMAGAFCGLLLLAVRWRVAWSASLPLAVLVYSATLLVEVAEAASYYFQASSFNDRFFANVRLVNLRSGLDAFPGLFASALVVVVGAIMCSAWLFTRQNRGAAPVHSVRTSVKYSTGCILLAIAVLAPSAWHRLARSLIQGDSGTLATSSAGRAIAASLGPGTERDAVRASAGKNLVIVYMESLERIYTDDKIFPGLTPNLNRWRARGLDFSDFHTFTGASYTMAGLFASQCGVPFFTTPSQVLDFTGNDANATSFQPNLACLGDVLHAAGYQQAYMNGAPLSFADQGAFFRMHGFNEVLGLDEIEDTAGGVLKASGWGLYDRDLFKLAVVKFDRLATSGRPFNLDLLTIDNHPPHGRPSPGCPKYAASSNSTLQSVHCTDYLVGKFLDTISRSPAWKNTVVVVMSDHQSMRNDAWPLYPKAYQRRPLLFILNAGQGRRDMRLYHMDVAPTVLHLMGVRTNADFIAGADRSAVTASGSTLVNDRVDAAVLRHAVWQRAQPLALCRGGTLVGFAPDGFTVGGLDVPMSGGGQRLVGIGSGQELALLVGKSNVVSVVENASRMPVTLRARGPGAALLIRPLAGTDPMRQFSLTWVGTNGARAALGDVPRLDGLQVSAPQCAQLLQPVNAAPAGQRFDLRGRFSLRTAPLYPPLPRELALATPVVRPFQRGLGWFVPNASGSWTAGDAASLGFTLPADACHAARLEFKLYPFFAPSRPNLAVKVLANGQPMTTWRFTKAQAAQVVTVATPVSSADAACRVDLRFEFERPGAAPKPYPPTEDPRPLQIEFKSMRLVPAAQAGKR